MLLHEGVLPLMEWVRDLPATSELDGGQTF
jgi:hypothetical protein